MRTTECTLPRLVPVVRSVLEQIMNVDILSIKPDSETGKFNVILFIGQEQHNFTVTIETVTVADRDLDVINGDLSFSNLFKFSQDLECKVCKLVEQVHKKDSVELPVFIGEFYPAEVVLASLHKSM